jgi:hypothetical protein
MGGGRLPGPRQTDDVGGVWIVTGWVVGLLVYAGVVLMAIAGFSAVLPLVVVPPVLLGLNAAGNLLGGRRHRSTPASGPDGSVAGSAPEEPGTPP